MSEPTEDEQSLRDALAHNVLALRTRKGWSQETAAEKTELHLKLFQKVEYGGVNSTLKTLSRLARGFEVTPDSLLKAAAPRRRK